MQICKYILGRDGALRHPRRVVTAQRFFFNGCFGQLIPPSLTWTAASQRDVPANKLLEHKLP